MRVNADEREAMRRQGYLAATVAAQLARVHVSTVYRAIDAGEVGARRIGANRYVNAAEWARRWEGLPERANAILAAVR